MVSHENEQILSVGSDIIMLMLILERLLLHLKAAGILRMIKSHFVFVLGNVTLDH